MTDRREDPATEAGRSLVRQWIGHPNEGEVRIVVGAIEEQARSPAPLDVERLIEAEKNTPGPAFPMSEFLPRLAAEYTLLSSQPSTEPARGEWSDEP